MAGDKIVRGFSETYIETAVFGGLTEIRARKRIGASFSFHVSRFTTGSGASCFSGVVAFLRDSPLKRNHGA